MEKNIAIKCYQTLLLMESEHYKINEMIMAPKFAKLLNESVDEDDFKLHTAKTIEIVSEFVNKAFDSMDYILTEATGQIEDIRFNNRLVLACENKMKSLTREDRDNFLLEKININITESKEEILKDMQLVNEELSKILECSFTSKEEYSKSMKSFRDLISECSAKLNFEKPEVIDISMDDLSNIFETYKNTDIVVEKDASVLKKVKYKLKDSKDKVKSKIKNVVKVKEAVYEATEYLLKATCVVECLISHSNSNNVNILCEFISSETSDEASLLFESTMTNIIRQNSIDDDYDDFLK